MSIVLDLIVVLIILAVALISAKRGFVKVAIELAGFIAALQKPLPYAAFLTA